LRSKRFKYVSKPFRGTPNCRELKRKLQSFEGPSFFWVIAVFMSRMEVLETIPTALFPFRQSDEKIVKHTMHDWAI
jgi:hypothetical protein